MKATRPIARSLVDGTRLAAAGRRRSRRPGAVGAPQRVAAGLLLALASTGCGDEPGADPVLRLTQALEPGPGEVGIAFGTPHQQISGFGVSSAWYATDLSNSLADRLFSVDAMISHRRSVERKRDAKGAWNLLFRPFTCPGSGGGLNVAGTF